MPIGERARTMAVQQLRTEEGIVLGNRTPWRGPSTPATWQQGKTEPAGAVLARVKRFLQGGDETSAKRPE
jgi:hypothetical protein